MNGCRARSIRLVTLLLAGVLLGLAPTQGVVSQAQSTPDWTLRVPAADGLPEHVVFVPRQLRDASERGDASASAPVLIALHGMGDSGPVFAAPLLARAELDGVVVVAPSFAYGDWTSLTVAQEDLQLSQQILALLDILPTETDGVPVSTDRVRLIGFSRGAQLAHRFALAHPERTDEVAAFSAGTYTLPDRSQREILPFGTADMQTYLGHPLDLDALRQVHFLVGVGLLDANPSDLPRAWDPYEGSTRVQRAGAFVGALRANGIPAQLHVFAGVGHDLSAQMIAQGLAFPDERTGVADVVAPLQ
jgi:pimeloyl-ACP methyl ester carboxylesterase